MSNDINKKMQECLEAKLLFKHLDVKSYSEWESPDFSFVLEGRLIGLEHTRWFPTGKTIENNAWKEIERLIQKELAKSCLPPRCFFYTAITHEDGKKNYRKIAEEIVNGYRFMLNNNINRLDESGYDGFLLEKLSYLFFFPDMILKHFALYEMLGGVVSEKDLTSLMGTINEKEKKLRNYKRDVENDVFQEYWLSVFVPTQEFCITKGDTLLYRNSSYDRIYLMNGRDWIRTNGDTSSIIRLK